MKIFDLLNSYTSDAGSWSIEYNDHKIAYSEPSTHYISPENDGDELDAIDTKQDIYRLYWFNNTPVGHYCILANSIEELEEKIVNLIKDDNLTKSHNKEKLLDRESAIDELYGAIAGIFLFYGISPEKGSGKIITDLLKRVEKQLQRKTAECEELKEKLFDKNNRMRALCLRGHFRELLNQNTIYKQALDEIEDIIAKIDADECCYGDFDCENCNSDGKCETAAKRTILDIISKAKGEE